MYTAKKSEVEMERAKQAKIIRTMLRLKHSINFDYELNETLPDAMVAFDSSVQAGEIKQLTQDTVRKLLDD